MLVKAILLPEDQFTDDEDVVYEVEWVLMRELFGLNKWDYAKWNYEEKCEDYKRDQLWELNSLSLS